MEAGQECLGREEDLLKLDALIKKASGPVLITGQAGIGKTTLAKAYVQKYNGQYQHIAWVDPGRNLTESVAGLHAELPQRLGIPVPQKKVNLNFRFQSVMNKLKFLKGVL